MYFSSERRHKISCHIFPAKKSWEDMYDVFSRKCVRNFNIFLGFQIFSSTFFFLQSLTSFKVSIFDEILMRVFCTSPSISNILIVIQDPCQNFGIAGAKIASLHAYHPQTHSYANKISPKLRVLSTRRPKGPGMTAQDIYLVCSQ